MSFICGFCGNGQPPNTKPEKIITKVRMVIGEPLQVEDFETGMIRGISRERYEIVEEKFACPSCAPIKRTKKPQVVEAKLEES